MRAKHLKKTKPSENKAQAENTSSTNRKNSSKLLVLVFMVLLAGIIGWRLYDNKQVELGKQVPDSQVYSFENLDYEYSVELGKGAKKTNRENLVYLSGPINKSVKAEVQANPVGWPVIKNCSEINSSWKNAFKAKVFGKDYQVCSPATNSYMAIVEGAGSNHVVNIKLTSKQNASYNNEAVKTVLSTLAIKKSK